MAFSFSSMMFRVSSPILTPPDPWRVFFAQEYALFSVRELKQGADS
jgi:hypothetical protein